MGLNLPPKLLKKAAYSFVFGVITGPNSANTVTISNILRPLINQLLVLKDGVQITTFSKPEGVASHSANYFCPWCTARLPDLKLIKIGETRNGLDILRAAEDWKNSKTLSKQNDIQKKTGVQWSKLNRLPSHNPNMHLPLGIPHNLLEGVLAEHFRFRWGFQDETQEKKRALKEETIKKRRCLNNHQEYELDQESNESKHEDDLELRKGIGGGLFTTEELKMFCYILADLILPTGVGKLPKMLEASKNGKLKASDWLTLFDLVLPLIFLEIFFHGEEQISSKSKRGQFLQNTGHLAQCTRIACTRVVMDGQAGGFENAYARYT
ncbi:hypothetical protein O181_058405 [Austropuccinia psidii MF-1]|uniref:Uncharacterized protein n=1 Tax=Austropuccinia psidii MF-1 TaxID=1389203 RepID=A0A9Q3EGF8_9BASI|nr:hypothetical protein [Austropuccinia psidii MF-1]